MLIVEDDRALLRGLKDNFESAGYFVRTANDGRKGLDVLLKEPPDLLLLDLMLPSLNGLDVAFLIREKTLPTRVLFLTMYSNEAYVLEALRNGAYGYVLKGSGQSRQRIGIGQNRVLREVDNNVRVGGQFRCLLPRSSVPKLHPRNRDYPAAVPPS